MNCVFVGCFFFHFELATNHKNIFKMSKPYMRISLSSHISFIPVCLPSPHCSRLSWLLLTEKDVCWCCCYLFTSQYLFRARSCYRKTHAVLCHIQAHSTQQSTCTHSYSSPTVVQFRVSDNPPAVAETSVPSRTS